MKFEQVMRLQDRDVLHCVRSSRGNLTDTVERAVELPNAISDVSLTQGKPLVLASDGFIPFKDNIEEAGRYGIEVICEPEGALRSRDVERAAADRGMTLVRTRNRFFYH